MHLPTILTFALAALLPLALAAQPTNDPDSAPSPAEEACYAKQLSTGSGAASAIKGFCAQVANHDSDNDNPSSAADTSVNGYTAGGFDPSGVMTTAPLAAKPGCNVDLGSENECREVFWDVCQRGDEFGRGRGKKGCLGYVIV